MSRAVWRYEVGKLGEALAQRVAWYLPREVVKWCAVRVFAHATTGRWGHAHPDTIGYGEVMRRWEMPE